MFTRRTPQECREKVSELIAEAVPEPDAERREALLRMADEWGEMLRRRAREGRPTSH